MHKNIKQNNYSRYAANRDVISLFSGAMGLDIGLGKAGLNVAIGQDFDAACVKTMQANGHRVLGGDIREIQPQQLLDMTGLSVGEPFLICGGPPCQPFSTAGKRLGINDPRGSLFMDFIRMIDYIRPRFFVMENVKGIMSSPLKHVPLSERDESDPDQKLGTVLDVILAEFDKLGYKTVYGVLDAVNYGVPQFRERFVLIGSRDNEDIFLPIPTHFQMHQSKEYQWQTVRSVIEDLESDHGECATLSEERLKFLKMVPEGGNWRDLPENIIPIAMGGAYKSGGGKVGFYRRLSYNQPSPTVVTSPVQKATMMCHPTQDRPLSVKEYARIQQFPDDWVFTGTTAAKYRQIGNAVPVGLAEAIGKAVLSVANKTALVQTKRFRGTNVHNKIRNAIELGGNLYSCKNDLWYEFDLRNRGLAARSLYIPKKNMVISGLKEEIGVKNFGGIYIQSNTELCEYLIKVIGAFQSEDTEENKILLEVFLSYVFDNKVLEVAYKQDVNTSNMFKQLLEERFVRVSNELIEKMWAKIDTQEFVNKILTKNYTLYSIDNWSRKNDSI